MTLLNYQCKSRVRGEETCPEYSSHASGVGIFDHKDVLTMHDLYIAQTTIYCELGFNTSERHPPPPHPPPSPPIGDFLIHLINIHLTTQGNFTPNFISLSNPSPSHSPPPSHSPLPLPQPLPPPRRTFTYLLIPEHNFMEIPWFQYFYHKVGPGYSCKVEQYLKTNILYKLHILHSTEKHFKKIK